MTKKKNENGLFFRIGSEMRDDAALHGSVFESPPKAAQEWTI